MSGNFGDGGLSEGNGLIIVFVGRIGGLFKAVTEAILRLSVGQKRYGVNGNGMPPIEDFRKALKGKGYGHFILARDFSSRLEVTLCMS